jgi:hypothetical protein
MFGNTFVSSNSGKKFLPFGTHIDINPFTLTNRYPYSTTISDDINLINWVQSFKVYTVNNITNYWNIKMFRWSDDALIATVDTRGYTTLGVATTLITNSFSFSKLTINDVGLYISLTLTGSPGTLYLLAPAVRYF